MSPDNPRASQTRASYSMSPYSFNAQFDDELFISTKVVMLGESGVGKSSVLHKFAYGNF